MDREIERCLRQYREMGIVPTDSALMREVVRLIVEREARQAASDLEDDVLDRIEKSKARVRKPEPVEMFS